MSREETIFVIMEHHLPTYLKISLQESLMEDGDLMVDITSSRTKMSIGTRLTHGWMKQALPAQISRLITDLTTYL